VHARFFDFVSSVFPKLNRKCIPFVTDRETGLVNAIDKNFPNCDVIMCWNHLINDLKFNLQKMGADHSNIAVYVTNIKELLRCNSEDEYTEKKTMLTSKWSKPIVSYFQKLEKDILKHCGKWVIDKYQHLYDPFSGVTNNPCESMNAVIKRLNKFKELLVDCFALSMFYLQNYYITEFQRGLADIGHFN
jgi:transposase-like protein